MKKKPKIFIGSSTEGLEIASAIQENLDHDAEVTLWTQGVFNLSNVPIDDLLTVLNNSQFGIFVFTPDDVAKIRDKEQKVVRDNVLFELGLFIGRIGRNRTFFVKPREIDFHLPTDLTGIQPGDYSIKRDDGNLTAALGPFCSKVKRSLKEYSETIVLGYDGEPEHIVQIVKKKPDFWEMTLIKELLKHKMVPINHSYYNLRKELHFGESKNLNSQETVDFLIDKGQEIVKLYLLIEKNLKEEQAIAIGKTGQSGDSLLIKNTIDTLIGYCNHLLRIDKEIQSIKTGNILDEVIAEYKGTTNAIVDCLNKYIGEIELKCNWEYLNKNDNLLDVYIKLDHEFNLEKVKEVADKIRRNPNLLK